MKEDPRSKYPKGDVRRLLRLLLAMSQLDRPTLNALAAETGHHKQTILDDMTRLTVQLGVTVEKVESEYRIGDIGPVVVLSGIQVFLSGDFGNDQI